MMRSFFGGGYVHQWAGPVGFFPMAVVGALLFLVAVWSIIWKGWALWRAARRGEKGWFLALLILNTLGILEIIYLFVITKDSKKM